MRNRLRRRGERALDIKPSLDSKDLCEILMKIVNDR